MGEVYLKYTGGYPVYMELLDRKMRRPRMIDCIKYLAMICIAILLLANLVYAEEQEKPREPAVAVVNGQRILRSDLDREVRKAVARNPELRAKENITALRKIRQEALDNLIDQELIFQEGKKTGLEPQDAMIDAELKKIEQRFTSEGEFEQLLKQQGLTEKKLRDIIRRGLTVQQVLTVKVKPTAKPVADKDVADFYEANKGKFVEEEKVKASHILIKVSLDASDQDKADAKDKIQSILKEAKGGADFAELAKKHSECSSASQGGDLGYFTRGQMVKPFEETAFTLQPGQVSDVVETQFGYHIILVQDKKPKRQVELAEVSERIEEFLYNKEVDIALKKWLKPLREKADINILLKS